MSTDLIGYLAGFLLTVCFLPQVIRTLQLKNAEEVSMWMLILTFGSAVLYEIYALRLGLTPVVVMNGIFGLLVLTEIGLKLHFDRRSSSLQPVD